MEVMMRKTIAAASGLVAALLSTQAMADHSGGHSVCQQWSTEAMGMVAEGYAFDKYLGKDAYDIAGDLFRIERVVTMSNGGNPGNGTGKWVCQAFLFYNSEKAVEMEKDRPRPNVDPGDITGKMAAAAVVGKVIYAVNAFTANPGGMLFAYVVEDDDSGERTVSLHNDFVMTWYCRSRTGRLLLGDDWRRQCE
jgi:hypothetical protein